MVARSLFSIALITLTTTLCNAADVVSCPDHITTRQELTSSSGGWTPLMEDTPHHLAGITFYDGPPSEKASLAYDRIKHDKGEDIASWTFARQEDRRIYLACSYAGTSIELTRSLPPQITTCTVIYATQEHIAGLPVIKKIACQ